MPKTLHPFKTHATMRLLVTQSAVPSLNKFSMFLKQESIKFVGQVGEIAELDVRANKRLQSTGGRKISTAFRKVVPVEVSSGLFIGGAGSYTALNAATVMKRDGAGKGVHGSSGGIVTKGKKGGTHRHAISKKKGKQWKYGWWFNQEFGKNPEVPGVNERYQENPEGAPFSLIPKNVLNMVTDAGVGTAKGMGVRPGRFIRHAFMVARMFMFAHGTSVILRAKMKAGFS